MGDFYREKKVDLRSTCFYEQDEEEKKKKIYETRTEDI